MLYKIIVQQLVEDGMSYPKAKDIYEQIIDTEKDIVRNVIKAVNDLTV